MIARVFQVLIGLLNLSIEIAVVLALFFSAIGVLFSLSVLLDWLSLPGSLRDCIELNRLRFLGP